MRRRRFLLTVVGGAVGAALARCGIAAPAFAQGKRRELWVADYRSGKTELMWRHIRLAAEQGKEVIIFGPRYRITVEPVE